MNKFIKLYVNNDRVGALELDRFKIVSFHTE